MKDIQPISNIEDIMKEANANRPKPALAIPKDSPEIQNPNKLSHQELATRDTTPK